jgi:hypothetical protein
VINADISGADFDDGWRRLPLGERVALYFVVPLVAAFMYFFGTRSLLAKHLQIDDLPSRDEILRGDVLPGFNHLLVDQRDAHLLRVIEDVCEETGPEKRCIGIVYGARHMRAVAGLLMHKLRYRVAGAEWITVFDL